MRKAKNGWVAKIPKARLDLLKNLLSQGLIYDLGQPYHPPMPHYPLHPALLFSLTRNHGDYMVFEFLFMVSPLKIKGGTASPVRPVAIV